MGFKLTPAISSILTSQPCFDSARTISGVTIVYLGVTGGGEGGVRGVGRSAEHYISNTTWLVPETQQIIN